MKKNCKNYSFCKILFFGIPIVIIISLLVYLILSTPITEEYNATIRISSNNQYRYCFDDNDSPLSMCFKEVYDWTVKPMDNGYYKISVPYQQDKQRHLAIFTIDATSYNKGVEALIKQLKQEQ